MVQIQESAYTGEVSWKDFLNPDEAEELRAAEAEKVEAVANYNAVRRTLKSRCDARMRRSAEAEADGKD